ncbi:hypothetical protein PGQ11_015200 [Apiospora arundinis]|uniref:Uncharacterized protein n=1 Tax=Apiospora arundinis TaxID=335852 RepID=A0ABR2HKP9_9PEZI
MYISRLAASGFDPKVVGLRSQPPRVWRASRVSHRMALREDPALFCVNGWKATRASQIATHHLAQSLEASHAPATILDLKWPAFRSNLDSGLSALLRLPRRKDSELGISKLHITAVNGTSHDRRHHRDSCVIFDPILPTVAFGDWLELV